MSKELQMNWNSVDGTWQRFKGKVKAHWALPDDDRPDAENNGGLTDMLQGAAHSAWDRESEAVPLRRVQFRTS